jgi:hypothetical protein
MSLFSFQVFLWDAQTWKLIDRLSGHSLTVIQMEFSPCDNFLLTVSRDRTWSLFQRCSDSSSSNNDNPSNNETSTSNDTSTNKDTSSNNDSNDSSTNKDTSSKNDTSSKKDISSKNVQNKFVRIAHTDKATSVHQRLIW